MEGSVYFKFIKKENVHSRSVFFSRNWWKRGELRSFQGGAEVFVCALPVSDDLFYSPCHDYIYTFYGLYASASLSSVMKCHLVARVGCRWLHFWNCFLDTLEAHRSGIAGKSGVCIKEGSDIFRFVFSDTQSSPLGSSLLCAVPVQKAGRAIS